jgi:hypothetical protein
MDTSSCSVKPSRRECRSIWLNPGDCRCVFVAGGTWVWPWVRPRKTHNSANPAARMLPLVIARKRKRRSNPDGLRGNILGCFAEPVSRSRVRADPLDRNDDLSSAKPRHPVFPSRRAYAEIYYWMGMTAAAGCSKFEIVASNRAPLDATGRLWTFAAPQAQLGPAR